jgi:DNA-binding transcriptional ArsR family regulator
MDTSRLEAVIRHNGRLKVLSCLWDGGPLSASQIAARIEESVQAVTYWVKLLDSFNLVEHVADSAGDQPMYVLTLDEHPDWVREMIETLVNAKK